MRSQRAVIVGEQQPRVRLAPDWASNAWEEVADLGKAYGLIPDEWQSAVLRDILGELPDGRWAAPVVGISVPRQNGKGAVIELRELGGLLLFGERILHTAHETKTSLSAFRRIKGFFENFDDLSKLVRRISHVNGQEAIHLSNGATLQFAARSKSSGRGFSVDVLILDEAQEFSEDAQAAILPTISASANPQTILLGTPPAPNMNGEVFARLRQAGLERSSNRLAYLEWSATAEDDPGEPGTWARANPAQGIRLGLDTIRDEYVSMPEDYFARERLGMWDDVTALTVIPADTWAALASETDPTGRVAFAVDVNPDRSRASIGVAGYLPDGRVHVQVVDNRKGTGWVAPRLGELTDRWPHLCVVVDSAGPAAALLPALKQARVGRVQVISTREVAQACGGFYDAVMDGSLAHPDTPVLNDALAVAKKRPLGEAWAWHRKGVDADITPLVSVTFAAFGLVSRRRGGASADPSKVLVL